MIVVTHDKRLAKRIPGMRCLNGEIFGELFIILAS
jgi:hypothetical protein